MPQTVLNTFPQIMSITGQVPLKRYLLWSGLPCPDYAELIKAIIQTSESWKKLPSTGQLKLEKISTWANIYLSWAIRWMVVFNSVTTGHKCFMQTHK